MKNKPINYDYGNTAIRLADYSHTLIIELELCVNNVIYSQGYVIDHPDMDRIFVVYNKIINH